MSGLPGKKKEYNHFFPPVQRHDAAVIILILPEHNRCDIRKTRRSKSGSIFPGIGGYLHKSSRMLLKMDQALAVGNAHENSMLDEIYLEAESPITRPLPSFFFLCRARGALVLPIIPSKSARNGSPTA